MKKNNYTMLRSVDITINDVLNEIERFKKNFIGFEPTMIVTTPKIFDELSYCEFCTSHEYDIKTKVKTVTFCDIYMISSPTIQPGTVIIV